MIEQKKDSLQTIIKSLDKNVNNRCKIINNPPLIVIFGGTGFIGSNLCRKFCSLGYRIRTISRFPFQTAFAQQIGNFDQIQMVKADLNYNSNCGELIAGASYIIFAAKGDRDKGYNSYDNINKIAALNMAKIAKANNTAFIYFSSLQQKYRNDFSLAKACSEAEDILAYNHKYPIIIRPSLVFGAGNNIFNYLATKAGSFGRLSLFGQENTILQPVDVKDIADFIAWMVESNFVKLVNIPSWFELGGPQKLTVKAIIDIIGKIISRKISVTKLPKFLGKIGYYSKLYNKERYELLNYNSVVSQWSNDNDFTFKAAQIIPNSFASTAASYLWHLRPNGQFAINSTPDWAR